MERVFRDMQETLVQKQTRAMKILRKLKKAYPKAGIVLNYKTSIQLLVAVILSAQATDEQVNKLTQELFKKYKTVDDFANANLHTFTREVARVNFYKNKARFIISSAKKIRDDYNGKLPRSIDEMVKLSGVARKTANIVLHEVYAVVQGIAVDTHVIRVSRNLGLTKEKNPDKIEQGLMALFPKKEWGSVAFLLQAYGRTVMKARGKASKDDILAGLY